VYQQQQPFAAAVQSVQPHVLGAGTPHGGLSACGGSDSGDTSSGVGLLPGFQHNSTSWNQSYVDTPAATVDVTAYESNLGLFVNLFISYKCHKWFCVIPVMKRRFKNFYDACRNKKCFLY